DGAADQYPLVVAHPLAIAADHRRKLIRLAVEQHDAAAVRFDPLEDQLHDAVEELLDIERVAHGQRRAIHDLQVAAGPRQPGAFARRGRSEDLAPFLLRHRADDARAAAVARGARSEMLPDDTDGIHHV